MATVVNYELMDKLKYSPWSCCAGGGAMENQGSRPKPATEMDLFELYRVVVLYFHRHTTIFNLVKYIHILSDKARLTLSHLAHPACPPPLHGIWM